MDMKLWLRSPRIPGIDKKSEGLYFLFLKALISWNPPNQSPAAAQSHLLPIAGNEGQAI